MKPRFRAEWVVVRGVADFGKLFTETNEQKFSLGGVQCKKICSHPGRNLMKVVDDESGEFVELVVEVPLKELTDAKVKSLVRG